MIRVEKRVLQRNLMYKGTVILKYRIEYPQIFNCEKFNIYNYKKATRLQKECETTLFNEAKELYEYNKKNGYPIMTYEIVSECTITYNYEPLISLYIDEYRFTGGAHGNTIRTSQNWNLQDSEMIKLERWFDDPNYVSKLIDNINCQIQRNIANGNNIYFEDYCCLTSKNFRVENYYIKNGLINIYYGQYDIAPYSSGIISFVIPK